MIVRESGLKYAKLIHVSVDNGLTAQSNKVYIMEEQSDGKIKCDYGRVGKDLVTVYKQAHEWDKVLRSKTNPRKGYHDVTDLISETVPTTSQSTTTNTIADIKDSKVKSLFDDLMAFANKSIQKNYKVTQDSVTEAQIDAAQEVLNKIGKIVKVDVDVKEINDLLIRLYTIIPRKMNDVRDYLIDNADSNNDMAKVKDFLANEQDTLDTMAGQVKLIKQQKDVSNTIDVNSDNQITLLEQMGLEVSIETDPDKIELIEKLMGSTKDRAKTIYKCVNRKTQAIFDKNYGKARFKDRKLFWHGSRNENIFGVLQSGLLLRPNAVITGKMFGSGIYFANKATKSLGYSSVRGSYWVNGNSNKGFLMLFDVYHGNQKHIRKHDSSCYSLNQDELNKGEYDSVYAHGGADLRNDEFIVYDESKITIAYLIEIE